MAQPAINVFSSFELTDEETIQASMLSPLQEMYIRTKVAEIAQEKLALEFDTAQPLKFAQDEAYLKGQLDILSWILDCSAESYATAKAAVELQPDTNEIQPYPQQ